MAGDNLRTAAGAEAEEVEEMDQFKVSLRGSEREHDIVVRAESPGEAANQVLRELGGLRVSESVQVEKLPRIAPD